MAIRRLKKFAPAFARKLYFRYRIGKGPGTAVLQKWAGLDHSEDVFFASYPRSGNTWIRYLMTHLRFPAKSQDLESLSVAFPEIYSDIDIAEVPEPRWIKTHMLDTTLAKNKVVYLIREGQAVARSFYKWSGMSEYVSFEEFFSEQILSSHRQPWGSWHQHVETWVDAVDEENLLLVRYEDLRSDTAACLVNICSFLGLSHREVEIDAAIRKSTRESMQADFDKSRVLKGVDVGINQGAAKPSSQVLPPDLEAEYRRVARRALEIGGY